MAEQISGSLTGTTDSGDEIYLQNGRATLALNGTFDSGTVTLERKAVGATAWHPSADTYTVNDVDAIDLKAPGYVRVTLAGASGSADIDYEITAG